MSDLLHQKYITDENGEQTDVILDLAEFAQLLQAASAGSDRFKLAANELIESNARLRELLEEIEDREVFDQAKRAPAEEQAAISFDQATSEIETARK